jgi:hypothetical protein
MTDKKAKNQDQENKIAIAAKLGQLGETVSD